MNVARHTMIHGRVQGVGFRAFVEDTAERLGLAGWVRNRRDGTVEALFAGGEQAVTEAIAACRQGPRGSGVTKIDVQDGQSLLQPHEGARFTVLPTA
jgi:acylphosphatase